MFNSSARILLTLIVSVSFTVTASAKGDMTSQQATTVNIKLGNAQNRLQFFPAQLHFETGKLYKLVIHNPSAQKHYFTAPEMSRAVFTRKVQLVSQVGNTLAEVKGRIDEIEVYPGQTAEWWFVPVKTLTTSRLHCSIKGHSAAGMTGYITIK